MGKSGLVHRQKLVFVNDRNTKCLIASAAEL